jgi:hypothetical protein
MGYSPQLWGKQGWHFIHYVALNYPINPTPEDKKKYLDFLNNLHQVLPCPFCGMHFKENMEKHPPRLDNREEFFNWTVDMHNFVNELNGKKKLTYAQAFKHTQRNGKDYEMMLKHYFEGKEYLVKGVAVSFLISAILIIGVKNLVK